MTPVRSVSATSGHRAVYSPGIDELDWQFRGIAHAFGIDPGVLVEAVVAATQSTVELVAPHVLRHGRHVVDTTTAQRRVVTMRSHSTIGLDAGAEQCVECGHVNPTGPCMLLVEVPPSTSATAAVALWKLDQDHPDPFDPSTWFLTSSGNVVHSPITMSAAERLVAKCHEMTTALRRFFREDDTL